MLAGVFLVSYALVPVLGAGQLYGVSRAVREIGLPVSMPLLLPAGAFALPLALVAGGLICELYGRRRARALLVVALVLTGGLLGLLWATDHVPDFDGGTTRAFGPGLAFAGCAILTCFLQLELLHGLGRAMRGRHLWLRNTVSAVVGLAAGWGGFAMIVRYVPRVALPPLAGFEPIEQLTMITITASAVSALATIALTLVMYVARRALAIYLRVEPFPSDAQADDREPRRHEPAFADRVPARKPPAQIVEPSPSASQSGPSHSRPFTRDEVAFFDAGEELATKSAADSFSDLNPRKR